MKFFGKKVISIALAALLVVSAFVTFPLTAGATTIWTVGSSSYLIFDNTNTGWTQTRWRMLVVTDIDNVAKTDKLVYVYKSTKYLGGAAAASNSFYYGFAAKINAIDEHIRFITFVQANNDSTSSGALANQEAKIDFKTIYNNDDSINTSNEYGITSGNYTENYSSGFNNTTSSTNFVVTTSGTSPNYSVSVTTSGTTYSGLNKSIDVTSSAGGSVSYTGNSLTAYEGRTSLNSTVASNSTTQLQATYASSLSLIATPDTDNGYMFNGWYDSNDNRIVDGNGVTLSNDGKTLTCTVKKSESYTAKFIAGGVLQTANVGSGGTASISGGGYAGTSITVPSGTSVTFTALPNPQYKFVGWYNNSDFSGDPVSTDDPYTFTATSANTLYAKFAAATYSSEEVTLSTKNNGKRNVNSIALSEQAKEYYQDEVKQYITSDKVYQTFVSKAAAQPSNETSITDPGFTGNSWQAMQNNDLFETLYGIMESTQNHGVVYASYGNNSLAHYWLSTDTSYDNTEDARGVYTMFYSNVDCYGHANMQREHIWPKSKASFLMKTGLGGSDLHHLRPAYGKVNNIKSNWGFADMRESNGNWKSGWTKHKTVMWPNAGANAKISLWRAEKNGETFCDYNDDVHGDIARILLYVYTRWRQPNLYTDITTTDDDGNTVPDTSKLPELDPDDSKDTGERIIYDLPTLLQWMKEDPVSEWEMQRNDLTQQVQGNRNVFIDYPELAWLLFDQTVPSNMETPSQMAKNQNDSSKDIAKTATVTPTNPVTLDFTTTGNGAAHITAYNNTTHMAVKNGDQVSKGDIITYSVVPDESTLRSVIEFSSDSTGTGNTDRNTTEIGTDDSYSFTRQAGYFRGSPNTINYDKDRIQIQLRSKVCVINYKINSKTTSGNTGGSGSGMVTVRTDTGALVENGGTVPNGTSLTFTFTPDYGSRFDCISNSNQINIPEPTNITGTDTYKTTFSVSSLTETEKDGKVTITESGRTKKFTAYFAQTFNANDKVKTEGAEYDKKQHINNKGMRPDLDDPWGDETDFTENFEICGVQIKTDEANTSNKALRFVSVIDKDILSKAQSYGYVIGYTNRNMDNDNINRYAYALVKDGNTGLTVDCTGKSNDIFGDYGSADTTTNYKYLTAAVNNIQDGTNVGLNTTIIARPYVVLKPEYQATNGPSVIYGQYMDVTTGEAFCACSGSYNAILAASAS